MVIPRGRQESVGGRKGRLRCFHTIRCPPHGLLLTTARSPRERCREHTGVQSQVEGPFVGGSGATAGEVQLVSSRAIARLSTQSDATCADDGGFGGEGGRGGGAEEDCKSRQAVIKEGLGGDVERMKRSHQQLLAGERVHTYGLDICVSFIDVGRCDKNRCSTRGKPELLLPPRPCQLSASRWKLPRSAVAARPSPLAPLASGAHVTKDDTALAWRSVSATSLLSPSPPPLDLLYHCNF